MTSLLIRDTLIHAVQQPSSGGQSIWAWLAEKLDVTQERPQAAPGIVASRFEGRDGVYTVLKNPQTRTYFRLSEKDAFLWQRMDGSHTVKDLVVAYFKEYKVLAFGRVSGLIEGLKSQHFLSEPPVNIYQQVQDGLARRAPHYHLVRLGRAFIEKEFALYGIDGWLTQLYQCVGWLFYTVAAQVLLLLISLIGLFCFSRVIFDPNYSLTSVAGSPLLGMISLFFVYLCSIFLHEMGHALTVKHYRREVVRGGFMIYYGFPAFFVDTSDIWMEGKRARLVTTLAGPYVNLILAGLASLVLFLRPGFSLNPFLYQFAMVTYIDVLFNMNPLLELDGYFFLMDSLEIPMLRHKSLDYIRSSLWVKLKGLWASNNGVRDGWNAFSREERIFTLFGALSAFWTVYSLWQALDYYQNRVAAAVMTMFGAMNANGRTAMLIVGALLGIGLLIYLGYSLISLARRGLAFADKARLFATPWRKATWAWGAALLLGAGASFYPFLALPVSLGALALWLYFTARSARVTSGSRLARMFWLMSSAGCLFLLSEAASLFHIHAFPFAWITALAGLLFALGAAAAWMGIGLLRLSWVEKMLLLIDLLAGCAWAVLATLGTISLPVAGIFPLLALALLLPALVNFWQTSSALAFVSIELGVLALLGAELALLPGAWAYLFLAAGFGLQWATYQQHPGVLASLPEPGREQSDSRLLKQAACLMAGSLNAQLLENAGKRPASILAEQFNQYAQAAGWRVQLKGSQVEDTFPAEWGLRQIGESSAAAMNLLLDLITRQLGEKRTRRALQQAYDALPWEAREIASIYVFSEVKFALALGQQFQAAQLGYQSLLGRIPLFAMLSQQEMQQLCARMRSERFAPGQTIIRQGQRGDQFYVLVDGSVEVSVRNEHGEVEIVDHLKRGNYFGECALLENILCTSTCRAVTPCEVISLKRADFDRMVKVCFTLRENISGSITRANLLRQIPLFVDLDEQALHAIAVHMRSESRAVGDVIIRQGEPGDTFYVIEDGRVQVLANTELGEKVVNERGPGEYFGEMALLLKTVRNATIRALTPTRLLALDRAEFEQLVAPQLYHSRILEQETSRRMIQLQRIKQT